MEDFSWALDVSDVGDVARLSGLVALFVTGDVRRSL